MLFFKFICEKCCPRLDIGRFGLGSREVARKRCIQVHSWRRKECCEICGRDHCSKQRRSEVLHGYVREGDAFYQRCIVHQVRNTLKYVPDKDRKAFASDLKTIYHASDEEKARLALDRVTEKWTAKYPNSMKRWYDNWDAITPIFKFSPDVRKVIYTTNAIKSLNSTYRNLNRQRSVFPSDTALLKALYLATFEATKKWTMSIRNWGQVYGELSIMYEGRLPE